jgi:hypothetical protein
MVGVMSHPAWLQQAVSEGRVSGLHDKPAQSSPNRRGGRAIRKADGPNKTESRYAREVLEPRKRRGEVRDYCYEPLKFRLADKTYYSPDFLVVLADGVVEFVEVKGRSGDGPYCEDDAAVKIKVAAAMYPFTFRMVWPAKGGGWSEREY